MQRYLFLEHVNLVNQLVYCLAASLADAFVIPEYILETYVRRAQVIKKESFEFLLSVIVIYPHWVLSVPGIMGEILKVSFCQHHLFLVYTTVLLFYKYQYCGGRQSYQQLGCLSLLLWGLSSNYPPLYDDQSWQWGKRNRNHGLIKLLPTNAQL